MVAPIGASGGGSLIRVFGFPPRSAPGGHAASGNRSDRVPRPGDLLVLFRWERVGPGGNARGHRAAGMDRANTHWRRNKYPPFIRHCIDRVMTADVGRAASRLIAYVLIAP